MGMIVVVPTNMKNKVVDVCTIGYATVKSVW